MAVFPDGLAGPLEELVDFLEPDFFRYFRQRRFPVLRSRAGQLGAELGKELFVKDSLFVGNRYLQGGRYGMGRYDRLLRLCRRGWFGNGSFLFLFAGIRVDAALNTGPFFMLGMLILAVFLVMARLYAEFKKTNDRMGNVRRRHA